MKHVNPIPSRTASASGSLRQLAGRLATCVATLAAFALVGAFDAPAASSPPDRLPYQGHLVDGNGAALGTPNPANYQVNFRIWDEASGGNLQWSEQQTVTVDAGLFSVTLGEGTTPGGEPGPALSSIFSGSTADKRFLELTVNLGGTPLTLLPRLRLLPAPYAYLASQATKLVTSNGGTLLSESAGTVSVPGPALFNGRLSLGNGLGNSKLAVWDGDGGANAYGLGVSSGDFRFHINNTGSQFSFRPGRDADPIMTLGGNGELRMASVLSDNKISLWGTGTGSYGFGIRSAEMRLHLDGNGGGRFTFLPRSDSASPLFTVHGNGDVRAGGGVQGSYLEAGVGVAGKEGNAGRIMYQVFSDGLDIKGAGNQQANRKITLWAEGGTTYKGSIRIENANNVGAKNSLEFAAGLPGKQPDGGRLGYKLFSNGLDIIGAGEEGQINRQIKMWAEGGTYFTGRVGVGTDGPRGMFEVFGGNAIFTHRIGIGTATPRAPLEVSGAALVDYGTFAFYTKGGANAFNPFGTVWTGNAPSPANVSILANERIVASEFNAFSDARIKQVIAPSDAGQDLATILRLRVTDYAMVDKAAQGTGTKKGFLAQEVEKVMPEAVSRSTRFVPDIYSVATAVRHDAAKGRLTVTLGRDTEVRVGDKVQYVAEAAAGLVARPVVEVRSAREFVLGDVGEAATSVFVYGREVTDFRTLDYDRIFTTGIGAIQELHRRSETQAEEIAVLRKQVAGYQTAAAAMEARFKALETRLAALAEPREGEAVVASANPIR